MNMQRSLAGVLDLMTDDEEREENIDSLVLQEYDGEDMLTIEWNGENPELAP